MLHQVEPAAGAEVSTLFSAIRFAFLPSRAGAVLMGSMGILGLVLALVGLYGTLLYTVTSRAPEIAVRKALGASNTDVARMVFGESMRLIAWGGGAGLVVAVFVTRPLATFLVPGLDPSDPITFAVVAALFIALGTAAAFGPARYAAALDPAAAIRAD